MQNAVALRVAMNKMQERQSVLVSEIKRIKNAIGQSENQLKWDTAQALGRKVRTLQDEEESLQKSLNVYQATLKNFQVKTSISSAFQSSSKEDVNLSVDQEKSNNKPFEASYNVNDLLTKNIQIEALNEDTVQLLKEVENDIRVIQTSSKSLLEKVSRCRMQLQESSRLNELLHKKIQFDLEIDAELKELKKVQFDLGIDTELEELKKALDLLVTEPI